MDENQQPHRSHLFAVRLWREELGAGQTEWRGKVQYVIGGERRYFRDWSTLVSFLSAKLQEIEDCADAV
ncbi:hypothetical protein D6833_06850 [Candidatus Parcubacteria bacterium]|nr:MAG: hypothetical protein D6833_06850 [Candidatus Parcubacteria bacterium]